MGFAAETTIERGVVVLTIAGGGGGDEPDDGAAAIAGTVRDLVDAGNAKIVVDAAAARPLSWLPFVPVFRDLARVRAAGGEIALVVAPGVEDDALACICFARLRRFAGVAEAVQALAPLETRPIAAERLSVETARRGSALVLALSGPLDGETLPLLEEALAKALLRAGKLTPIIADLARLTSLDEKGLVALMKVCEKLRPRFFTVSLPPTLLRVVNAMAFGPLLATAPDVDTILAGLDR